MQLVTLGGLQLEGSDFTRPKALLLLAFLALEGKQERRYLAELFWLGQDSALRNLSLTLSRLNKVAPEFLLVNNGFVEASLSCDALVLKHAFDQADYAQVEALYQGAFLQGVRLKDWCYELEEWVYNTRESLAAKLRTSLLELATTRALKADYTHAARLADQAYHVKHAPDAEASELKQVFTFLRAADHKSAKAVQKEAAYYDLELEMSMVEARKRLMPEIQSEQVHARYLTPFVGRDDEVSDITSQLLGPEVRLLCITGIGGVGKTRLASVVMRHKELRQSFPDGCHLISLETLQDASHIPLEIAGALDLQFTDDDVWRNLSMLLAKKHMLLALDNLEQVIEEAAIHIEILLKRCPNLSILATSREVLSIPGEVIYDLKGLSLPPHAEADFHAFGATALFISSAKRVKYSFNTKVNKKHILFICEQLQGWPLGIELAAPWVRQRSCEDIARNLQNNLDVLSTRSRTVVSRHKSARAAFDHSWNLLTVVERSALAKLSVFKGGFSFAAAFEVTQTTIPVLASLLDKSLLFLTDEGRYDQHPLVRDYGREKLVDLGVEQEVKQRHADAFFEFVRTAEEHLTGKDQIKWFDQLMREHDNLLTAITFYEMYDLEKGLIMVATLRPYWATRSYFQLGINLASNLLNEAGEINLNARISALNTVSQLQIRLGRFAKAEGVLQESLRIAKRLRNARLEADALGYLGVCAFYKGHFDEATILHEQSLTISRRIDDQPGVALALMRLGNVAANQNDYGKATTLLWESLALSNQLNDQYTVAWAHHGLGLAEMNKGDYAKAEVHYLESLQTSQEIGDAYSASRSLRDLGLLATLQDRFAEAKPLLEESLRIPYDIGDRYSLVESLGITAVYFSYVHQYDLSALLYGAASEALSQGRAVQQPFYKEVLQRSREVSKKSLGDQFSNVLQGGKALTHTEAVQLALAELHATSA